MTGISEILVLVLLIACILILPRLFKGEPEKKKTSKKNKGLPVKFRFGIVLSLVYPVVLALYQRPWKENLTAYISYGVIPVFLVWAMVWIMAGKKK